MKIVVIGGTGLIGAQVVQKLSLGAHEAIPAARYTGVDLITGDGLERVLKGAEVVINVANSPTFDEGSLDFFRLSMRNLLAAGAREGVGHQVVLSIVGVDRAPQVAYFRAKYVQEELLRQGPSPFSIVRATQFFEFMDTVISWASNDSAVRLPSTRIQPVASAEVVDAVVEVSLGPPLMGIRNVAGPDVFALDELGRVTLRARGDGRRVITDEAAGLFGAITGRGAGGVEHLDRWSGARAEALPGLGSGVTKVGQTSITPVRKVRSCKPSPFETAIPGSPDFP